MKEPDYWQSAISSTLQRLIDKPRLGLVTDVDGTISPIVTDPDAAQVTPRNRELLRSLQPYLALVAVISGRAVVDVRDRVNVPELIYVGNHGLEWWAGDHVEIAPEAQTYRPALEAALEEIRSGQIPGMRIEDKRATLSVHYRQAANPRAFEAAFSPTIRRIAAQHGLKLFQGRMVFELRPPLDINKGSAFFRLVQHYQLDAALYLGDDTTDADALDMARRLRQDGTCDALGLGVVSDDTPASVRDSADLLLAGVADVEAFLSWMLSARKASSTWS
jgi:trehalose 6-phosphate phosphatase